MAVLLTACSKLEDLALFASYQSQIVDIIALSAGAQLLRLRLTSFDDVSDLSPLAALVNLQSLNISGCDATDLAPLGALVDLQNLEMVHCEYLSDLAASRPCWACGA
jgi:internalin A